METFQLAEQTLAYHMVCSDHTESESNLKVREDVSLGCVELQQREAETRLFHCCQSTSVETVTELTEFAKAVPGFQSLDLNDQVGQDHTSVELGSVSFCYTLTVYAPDLTCTGDTLEVWRL